MSEADPIDWRAQSEWWREACLRWQRWAGGELSALGVQPEGGAWGDQEARARLSAELRGKADR